MSMKKLTNPYPNQKQTKKKEINYKDEADNQDEKKVKTTGPIHNPKYKLKLCEKFEADGVCPYFEKCQFAHGAVELEKWMNRQKKLLEKAEKPQQRILKSPVTPQQKFKKYNRGESTTSTSSSSPTINGSESSPIVTPEKSLNKPINESVSTPASQKTFLSPIQQNPINVNNPWFSKKNPLTQQKSSPETSKLSIDSSSQDFMNPTILSLNEEAKTIKNISDYEDPKSGSFDEENMLKELEKIVFENNNDTSNPQINYADNEAVQTNSALFEQGYLQVPSNSISGPFDHFSNQWNPSSSLGSNKQFPSYPQQQYYIQRNIMPAQNISPMISPSKENNFMAHSNPLFSNPAQNYQPQQQNLNWRGNLNNSAFDYNSHYATNHNWPNQPGNYQQHVSYAQAASMTLHSNTASSNHSNNSGQLYHHHQHLQQYS